MRLSQLAIAASFLALAACTRNTVILVAQRPLVAANVPDPACQVPPPSRRITPPGAALTYPAFTFPERAKQAGVQIGCAGVLFHIGTDGRVIDPMVAVESPPGFEFGQVVLQALPRMLWQPHPQDPTWHYLNVTLRNNAVPAARPTLPRATAAPYNPFKT